MEEIYMSVDCQLDEKRRYFKKHAIFRVNRPNITISLILHSPILPATKATL
jgi:hypothetical protein